MQLGHKVSQSEMVEYLKSINYDIYGTIDIAGFPIETLDDSKVITLAKKLGYDLSYTDSDDSTFFIKRNEV